MDYTGRSGARSRSASRERHTGSGRKHKEEELRSTNLDDFRSQTVKKRKQAEAESLVESCKIKNAVLKEKLRSAEIKLRDLIRNQQIQRQVQAKSGSMQQHTKLWYDSKHVKDITSVFVKPSSVSEEQRLSKLKEDRAVQNHNLNILQTKIERLRNTESQLIRQKDRLFKEERSLNTKLTKYQDLARENLELKSKVRRAAHALS